MWRLGFSLWGVVYFPWDLAVSTPGFSQLINPQILQGPYSQRILRLRVAPSDVILRKFLEKWAFTLKIKEKILVKKKVIHKAS